MKTLFTTFVIGFIIFSSASFAQLALQWKKQSPVNTLFYNSTVTDAAGNLYVQAIEDGTHNGFLLKYDSLGNLLWSNQFLPDSVFTGGNIAPSILAVDDHSIYFFFTQYFLTDLDGVIRLDLDGNVLHETLIPDITPCGILPDNEGHYFLGYMKDTLGLYLSKYDTAGNFIFEKPAPSYTNAYGIAIDFLSYDKNHVLHLHMQNNYNGVIETLDTAANLIDSLVIQPQGTFAGPLLFGSQNHKYVIVGAGGNTTYIAKYDSAFNLIWRTTLYGGISQAVIDNFDNIYGLETVSAQGNFNCILHKIDSAGQHQWSHDFNYSSMLTYWAFNLIIDGNGFPLIAGRKYDIPASSPAENTNKYFFLKMKPNGMPDDYYEGFVPGATSVSITDPVITGTPYNFAFTVSAGLNGGGYYSAALRFCTICKNNITGKIIYDSNDNCLKDANETYVPGSIVEVTPGPYYAASSPDGSYSFYLPDSVYSVWCHPPNNWTNTCPNVPVTDTISNGIGQLDSVNLGIKQLGGFPDLLVNIAHTPFRAIRPINYVINYQNLGDNIASGQVKFVYENFLVLQSTIPPVDTLLGDTLVWNFTNLLSGESRNINLVFIIPNVITGPYSNLATIEGFTGDIYAGNNFDVDSGVIGASFDPNEKHVQPAGTGPEGYITTDDSMLLYKIMFQNIGNDTAFEVLVVDTLDPDLDISSFHIGAVSKPYTLTVTGSGVLKFSFPNILLPDSTTDEPNSYGLINYYIKQKPDLPTGTEIRNFADIYFDFNAPVKTNTTLNTVQNFTLAESMLSENEIVIFPNPSSDFIHFILKSEFQKKSNESFTVEIYNSTAQKVFSADRFHIQNAIDISNLVQGFYIAVIRNENFISRMRFIRN